MGRIISYKFLIVRNSHARIVILFGLIFYQNLWAHQSAIVTSEKAVIFADEQMSAPLGFVRKGKKVKVGDIPRNRAQVYPIIVSGKMGFIRVLDISTEKESVESGKLVAERFQKNTGEEYKTNYALSLFNFSSSVSLNKENGLKDKDSLNWLGAGIRGGAIVSPKWDLDLIANFLNGKAEEEVFRVIELGIGGSFRFFEQSRFKARLFAQLLAVPLVTYAIGEDFRVNGNGVSAGGGLNLSYRLRQNVGIETFGGFYYMKLSGFDAPKPYNSIDASFVGTRLGAALNLQY